MRERNINIDCLLYMPCLGNEPATYVCVLTGNRTHTFWYMELCSNMARAMLPLSHVLWITPKNKPKMFYRPSFPCNQTNGQPRGSWGKRQEVSKFSVRRPLHYAPRPPPPHTQMFPVNELGTTWLIPEWYGPNKFEERNSRFLKWFSLDINSNLGRSCLRLS